MRRVLPVATPLAYAYQFYAFPLAILAERERSRDWVLSNYVQTAYDTDPGSPVPFCFYVDDFTRSPWLETQRLTREWCLRRGDRIDALVRDAVRDGWYVYLTVNERYIPRRRAYVEDVDYPHDVLVHGCDDDTDTFAILGYDEDQMFRATTAPQESLRTAFEAMGDRPFHDTGIVLYRYDETGHYPLDVAHLADAIEEYATGANTSRHHADCTVPLDRVWGARGYEPLTEHLDAFGAGRGEANILDVQVLWEHKRLMVARAERAEELGAEVDHVLGGLRRVERQAWVLRTMVLDAMEGERDRFRSEGVALLTEIAESERSLLPGLVSGLRGLGTRREAVAVPAVAHQEDL